MKEILTIDQGTTSSRSIIFNESLEMLRVSQEDYDLMYPNDGWVEADADEILKSVQNTLDDVLKNHKDISTELLKDV